MAYYTAKPTTYRGITFRSVLEAKTANALDNFGIKWMYEPRDFQLSNGLWYKPDFWLPESKMWVECKAEQYQEAIAKAHCLVNDTEEQIIMLGYDWVKLFRYWYNETPKKAESDGYGACGYDVEIVSYSSGIILAKCAFCDRWYFTSIDDSYECTCCNKYDGDSTFYEHHYISGVTDLFNKGQEIAAEKYSVFCN